MAFADLQCSHDSFKIDNVGVNISVDNRDMRRGVDIVEMSSRIAYTYLSDTDFVSVSFTESEKRQLFIFRVKASLRGAFCYLQEI